MKPTYSYYVYFYYVFIMFSILSPTIYISQYIYTQ